jgi:hypothetical protein
MQFLDLKIQLLIDENASLVEQLAKKDRLIEKLNSSAEMNAKKIALLQLQNEKLYQLNVQLKEDLKQLSIEVSNRLIKYDNELEDLGFAPRGVSRVVGDMKEEDSESKKIQFLAFSGSSGIWKDETKPKGETKRRNSRVLEDSDDSFEDCKTFQPVVVSGRVLNGNNSSPSSDPDEEDPWYREMEKQVQNIISDRQELADDETKEGEVSSSAHAVPGSSSEATSALGTPQSKKLRNIYLNNIPPQAFFELQDLAGIQKITRGSKDNCWIQFVTHEDALAAIPQLKNLNPQWAKRPTKMRPTRTNNPTHRSSAVSNSFSS